MFGLKLILIMNLIMGYNGVFNNLVTNDFRKLSGGANYDYFVYVYHEPSNVSVNVLERGGNQWIGQYDEGNEWSAVTPATNGGPFPFYNATDTGTFTVILNIPWNSTDGLHEGVVGGDEWDIDHDEFQDMTRNEIFWLRDQANFRTIAPYYDLNDDTLKDYSGHEELERLTNAFAVNFTFNDSISLVAGNVKQVNMTVADRDGISPPIELIVSDTSMLLIFYEPITFKNYMYNFDIDIFTIGSDINCTYVQTQRIFVPQGDSPTTLGARQLINSARLFDDLYDNALGYMATRGHWYRPR